MAASVSMPPYLWIVLCSVCWKCMHVTVTLPEISPVLAATAQHYSAKRGIEIALSSVRPSATLVDQDLGN